MSIEDERKTITLNSGRKIVITKVPFKESLALFKASMNAIKELGISFDGDTEIDFNFGKDVICSFIVSNEVETCFNTCLSRCLYKGNKVTDMTRDDKEFTKDYLEIFSEVIFEVCSPFFSSLPVVLSRLLLKVENLDSQK